MHSTTTATFAAVLDTASAFARDELRPVALQYDETEEYPRRAAAPGGGARAHLLRPARGVRRRRDHEPPRPLRGDRGALLGRLPDLLGDRAGRLLRRPGPRARERRSRRSGWLPPLCGPEPPACSVAITEPEHGSDSAAIETTARRVDGGYVLDGHKKFIGNAPIADVCVVFATVEPGARSQGHHGVRRRARRRRASSHGARLPKMGSRCFPAGELRFEECFVPDDRRLGGEGEGFSGLLHVFDVARVQLAASTLGVGRAALEHAVEYATRARSVRPADPRVPGGVVPARRTRS